MKKLLFIISFIFLLSCNDNPIHYETKPLLKNPVVLEPGENAYIGFYKETVIIFSYQEISQAGSFKILKYNNESRIIRKPTNLISIPYEKFNIGFMGTLFSDNRLMISYYNIVDKELKN